MSESVRHIVREIYCEVLFELAEESGRIDSVQLDLMKVQAILDNEPEFAAILNSPTIKGADKSESVRRVFKGYICDLAMDFLSVLARRNRMGFLASITDRYTSLVDRHHNRQPIEVRLPYEPSDEQVTRIREKLEKAMNAQVKLSVEVDNDLIGGIVIKHEDMVIDNSIKNALKRAARTVSENARVQLKSGGKDKQQER